MDRNKLIQIIQRDLNELTELTNEMAGKTQVSSLEIDFALGKSRIISQEFAYLKELSQQSLPQTETKEPFVSSFTSGETSHEQTLSAKPGDNSQTYPMGQVKNKSLTDEISAETDSPGDETETTEKVQEAEKRITEPVDPEQGTPEENEIRDEVVQEQNDVKKTVAEFFVHEKSVNETIASEKKTVDHKLAISPLSKLEAAIGLNDRFQFIRELFNNDAGLFNQTVKQIDQMPDINAAVTYLNSNFKWRKNETSLKFAQLVKRRFSN